MTSREEILAGVRLKAPVPERLTIEAALRQAYSLGHSDASIGLDRTDRVSSRLREIEERLRESLPLVAPTEYAVVKVDSRSESWTRIGRTGLEIRDLGPSTASQYILEYRSSNPDTFGSAGH